VTKLADKPWPRAATGQRFVDAEGRPMTDRKLRKIVMDETVRLVREMRPDLAGEALRAECMRRLSDFFDSVKKALKKSRN
jgi:hypothetical protein